MDMVCGMRYARTDRPMPCLTSCSNFEVCPDGKTICLHCNGRRITFDHIIDFYGTMEADFERLKTDSEYARNFIETSFNDSN